MFEAVSALAGWRGKRLQPRPGPVGQLEPPRPGAGSVASVCRVLAFAQPENFARQYKLPGETHDDAGKGGTIRIAVAIGPVVHDTRRFPFRVRQNAERESRIGSPLCMRLEGTAPRTCADWPPNTGRYR